MSIPSARNRMVVFRLTQEEYEHLKGICITRGGRSLSEFTRSELLSFLGSDSLGGLLESRFADMKERLAELQDAVSRLTILVCSSPETGRGE